MTRLCSWLVPLSSALLALAAARAADKIDTSSLREAVTVSGIRLHQKELQDIADKNNGTRASGSPGFDASLSYVEKKLRDAGYLVTVQSFTFPFSRENSPATLSRLSPDPKEFVNGTDFVFVSGSGAGEIEGVLVPTNDIVIPPTPTPSSTSGCEPGDFPPAPAQPAVALIQRGTCPFAIKARNAKAAGYEAIIFFNEGQPAGECHPGRQDVAKFAIDASIGIPAIFTKFSVGEELNEHAKAGEVKVRLKTDPIIETRTSANVIADTPGGSPDQIVIVGAHLDSVPAGPGINDNGSGTATILEIALQMSRLGIKPLNKLKFAFWGAEEFGLLGSEHYVAQLSPQELAKFSLNLNFDMLGSPNFARLVYDGKGESGGPIGPNGSATIQDAFQDYFSQQKLRTGLYPFDGRSDYGPFIDKEIPAGGLYSGGEAFKTPAEVEVYGGTACKAYDACYHEACDTFANFNDQSLDQLSDAAAHAVLLFAMSPGPVRGASLARDRTVSRVPAEELPYRGPFLQK